MAKTDFNSVDEYIVSRPEGVRSALEQVRDAVRKAMPLAEEVISYQMPAYKLNGKVALYFAGWKDHYSIYPASAAASAAMAAAFKDLARYEMSKGTIRFPLSEEVPVKLIEKIAKFRAKEAAGGEKAVVPRKGRKS